MGLIPGSGRSCGEENRTPLQYSCLGNPMDRGAWWTIVHGVAKESDTTNGKNLTNLGKTFRKKNQKNLLKNTKLGLNKYRIISCNGKEDITWQVCHISSNVIYGKPPVSIQISVGFHDP